MTNITPLDTYIVVKVKKIETKTAGGIILLEESIERDEMAQLEAEIISMGEFAFPGVKVSPKVGDIVLMKKFAGLMYSVDDEDYRIIDTGDGYSDVKAIKAKPILDEKGRVEGYE